MNGDERSYVQAVFPHTCYALVADCAICRWVRERWTGRELPANKPEPLPDDDRPSVGFTTCAQCGEIRIPRPDGKLPAHRCAA